MLFKNENLGLTTNCMLVTNEEIFEGVDIMKVIHHHTCSWFLGSIPAYSYMKLSFEGQSHTFWHNQIFDSDQLLKRDLIHQSQKSVRIADSNFVIMT